MIGEFLVRSNDLAVTTAGKLSIEIDVIASDSSAQLTKVATKTAVPVSSFTINRLRILIFSLCPSTPSVTCLICVVAAVLPEPHPVNKVNERAIENTPINFLKIELVESDMIKGYLFTKIKGKSGGKSRGELPPKMLVSLASSERLFPDDI
jgi:hypothetical protein